MGLGLQPPWSLRWSQGPFCLEAIPLPSVFSVSSVLFGLCLHKRWAALGCLLCFSVEWVGVSPRCRGKLTLLPPILLPSSLSCLFYFILIYFSWAPDLVCPGPIRPKVVMRSTQAKIDSP